MKWLKYYSLLFLNEQSTEGIINRGSDPYEYKVDGDNWLAKKKGTSKWFEISGKDYKPQFQKTIDILDSENPTLRTDKAPYKSKTDSTQKTEVKPTDNQKQTQIIPPQTSNNISKAPIIDNNLSKEFNFHLIPDGKNNYRSAQLPIRYGGKDFYKDIIERFGIKTVIRFNGDNRDGRHKKEHPITNIQQERDLLEGLGVKFHKLSSTRNQDKVNELLNQGNVLIHCAHGADRTGGNVGGYLFTKGWDTQKIWDYSTKYSGWKSLIKNNPNDFVKHGYLDQLMKFGVKDMNHARQLAGVKP